MSACYRLQLRGAGQERGASLRHAEALGRAQVRSIRRAALVADINRDLSSVRDAYISALQPPAIDNLGNASGFSFRLQDRAQNGFAQLIAAATSCVADGQCQSGAAEGLHRRSDDGAAAQPRHRPRPGQRVRRHLRRHQQRRLDRSRLATTSTTSRIAGACSACIVQADRVSRMNARRPPQVQRQQPARAAGADVVLRDGRMGQGADPDRCASTAIRRCASPATPAPGYTTGDAMIGDGAPRGQAAAGFGLRMDRAVAQEQLSGSTATILLALSMLVVFLCLAALYESWSIPLAVLLDGAARRSRRGDGGDAARHAERRLLQGRR